MAEETDNTPETPAGAPAEPAAEAAPKAGEASVDARIDALLAEVGALKDQLLRGAADMENLRRRTAREIADAKQYAVTGFSRELLSVSDNLRRALDAVPAEARAAEGPAKTLLEGVEMTERELLRVMEKHGIRRLDPVGQKFDPHFHQAIFEAETADAAPGTVTQLVQAGYAIGDRVLRPAMVAIAKAPKPPEPASVETPAPDAEAPANANEPAEASSGS
ncbi:MAG: nucleotide exchange factor GrpE [Bauldia sp.]|nr:nucleotide exchange factor GrpE [Bauldia sp.]